MPILTLLLSPLGRWLAAAAFVILTFGVGYWKGYAAADRAAEVRQLEAELTRARAQQAEAVRQAFAANRIAADATERQRRAESDAATLQNEVDAYAAELSTRTDRACAFTADDIARLRSLARSHAPNASASTRDVR